MNTAVEQMQKRPRGDSVVVCAAIRLSDGLVITGPRHYDVVMMKVLEALNRLEPTADQGFIDQFGNFLTRQEAFAIAAQHRQFHGEGSPHAVDVLYSEDLY